jgi:hypothetical protein
LLERRSTADDWACSFLMSEDKDIDQLIIINSSAINGPK